MLNVYIKCIIFDVKYINILVLGENGFGKFFFLNICVIVLENSKYIKDYFWVFGDYNDEESVILEVKYDIYYIYF